MPDYDRIKSIKDFGSLVAYLRDDLDWPIGGHDFEDLAFDYDPEELGLDDESSVKIREIKQLRPLVPNQPWGVFYIDFESKRLPVVVLRKILRGLVPNRRSASPSQAVWNLNDLLFISALGEEDHRGISFAHFRDSAEGVPQLQTFSWDQRETHFHYLKNLNMERLRWPDDGAAQPQIWRQQWADAFTSGYREVIGTAKELSRELARLAKNTRDLVLDIYRYETKTGPLHKLHESFRTVLIHDLDERRFADMIAQTVAYGLFSARATGDQVLGLKHLEAMIPNTNPFLQELFAEFTRIGGHGKDQIDFDELGVSNLVAMLNDADMDSVLRDFGRQTGGGREDPVVHFYELFLKEYDREQKVKRGEFYTPKPVVSFIVRSVDKILREEFGLPLGLADTTTWGDMTACNKDIKVPDGVSENSPFVQILDPATGTGTFLETVIGIVHDTMVEKWRSEGKNRKQIATAWNEYVPNHLLPRLYGFEMMMAPYAIAHLKLGLKLKETGYDFASAARLQVYLTNTLEEPKDFSGQLIPDFLSHEAQAANRVKDDAPTTVVVGNPPYSGHSWNLTPEARRIVEIYRYVDGVRIREKGALQAEKSVQDDYIKFIRRSEQRIEAAGAGVVGLVTSHGLLDNPTLRGVRWHLMTTFQRLSFLDLHGNLSRQEHCPDGTKDQNVFQISKTGIAVSLLRKGQGGRVHHERSDLYGRREESKYPWLIENDVGTAEWVRIVPHPPDYLIVGFDAAMRTQYEAYAALDDALPLHSKGVVTGRDRFVLDCDQDSLLRRISDFATSSDSDEALVVRYRLNPTDWWSVAEARHMIPAPGLLPQFVRQILYRPYDVRLVFYHPSVLMSPRRPVMQHLDPGQPNYLLITSRMTKGERFAHVTVSKGLAEAILLSSKTSNNAICFPLYLYPGGDSSQGRLASADERRPNFSSRFQARLQLVTGLRMVNSGRGDLVRTVGPEDVFFYIVAILHAPQYRVLYADFLSREFPRIPLTSDRDLFHSLCELGGELVALHLMEKHAPLITTYQGKGDDTVDKVRYTEPGQGAAQGRVWLNNAQYFEGVPPEVWEFHIGGYQVCEKWLKDRGPKKGQPGRKLSEEDILHYQRVVAALKETIRLMEEIDRVIEAHGGWPLPGSVAETSDPGDNQPPP